MAAQFKKKIWMMTSSTTYLIRRMKLLHNWRSMKLWWTDCANHSNSIIQLTWDVLVRIWFRITWLSSCTITVQYGLKNQNTGHKAFVAMDFCCWMIRRCQSLPETLWLRWKQFKDTLLTQLDMLWLMPVMVMMMLTSSQKQLSRLLLSLVIC